MSALNQAPYFNTTLAAPSAASVVDLQNSVNAFAGATNPLWVTDLANCPRSTDFILPSVSADSSGYSVTFPVHFPIKIVGVDMGCSAAAGSAGTMDFEFYNGSAWVSVFAAAKDVKTAAGTGANYAPESTTVDMEVGYLLRAKGTSGSGGALSGGVAKLWYVRR